MSMTPEHPTKNGAVAPSSSSAESSNNMSIDEEGPSPSLSSASVPSPPKSTRMTRIGGHQHTSPAARLFFDEPDESNSHRHHNVGGSGSSHRQEDQASSFILKPLDLNMELGGGEGDEAETHSKEDKTTVSSSIVRSSVKLFDDDDQKDEESPEKRKISMSPPHSPDSKKNNSSSSNYSYASPPSPEQTGYKSPSMSSSSCYSSMTKSPAIRTMDGRTVMSKNPFSPWCDGDLTPSGRNNAKQQQQRTATKPLSDSLTFPVSFATDTADKQNASSANDNSHKPAAAPHSSLKQRSQKRTFEEKDSNVSAPSFNLKPSKSAAQGGSLPSFSFSLRPKNNNPTHGQNKMRRLSTEEDAITATTTQIPRTTKKSVPHLQVDTHHEHTSPKDTIDKPLLRRSTPSKTNPEDISPTEVASFPFSSSSPATPTKTLPPPTPSKPKSQVKQYRSPPARSSGAAVSECYTPVRRPKHPHTPVMDRHRSSDQDEDNDRDTKQTQSQSRFYSDFDIIGELGKGSFGIVYQVLSRLDGCMYAVKAAHRPAKGHADKDRMLKEVYALAALSDQADPATFHIVRYHQAWMEDNRLYIQTELCTSTLSTELAQGSLSTNMRRYKFAREILLALEFLHRNGMVHLDIKPDNIFIKNDQFKLGDFGLVSKIAYHKDVEEGDSRYMSMELLSGDHDDLTKSDIFSLGITLYETFLPLGHNLPSNGPEWQDLRQAKIPNINAPKEMFDIIQVMMRPEYRDRPAASELLKRPQLLSEDQRALQAERNKVLQANMALVEQERRLRLLSPNPVPPIPPPAGGLVRSRTWNGGGGHVRRRSL